MNQEIPTVPLTPYGGGFYYADVALDGFRHALILAPKAEGEFLDVQWHDSYADVPGAMSYEHGRANTLAMAEAGSELAKKILALRIGGFDDWFLPALDQLEPLYRFAKPTADKNYCFARSGINMSAMPQTWPYTPGFPLQTENELFRAGGAEAMEPRIYWTSTQYAGSSDYAWSQYFDDGYQGTWGKDSKRCARAVRTIKR